MSKNQINPFFAVDRMPIYSDYKGERIILGREALINAETGAVYGLVTPKYKVVTNEEVADTFTKALDGLPINSITDHTNSDGSRWKRDIVFGGKFETAIKVGDVVNTKITIANGYDLTQPVSFEFGTNRLRCTNGMTGIHKEFSLKIRHSMNEAIEEIRKGFEIGFEKFSENFEVYKEWSRMKYTEKQFISFLNRNTKIKEDDESKGVITERQRNKIVELYPSIRDRYNDGDETVWSQLNVLTAVQTHHTKAHNGSNVFSAGHKNLQRLIENFHEEIKQAA